MGGMIAQQMALDYGGRIDKLVLYGTGPNGVMPGRFETIAASRRRVLAEGAATTIAKTVASWFMQGASDQHYAASVELAAMASNNAILGGL